MIAGHLISASLLSAPAALLMSKLLLPESEQPETLGVRVEPFYEKDGSLFEAVINGANSGVRMIVGIFRPADRRPGAGRPAEFGAGRRGQPDQSAVRLGRPVVPQGTVRVCVLSGRPGDGRPA